MWVCSSCKTENQNYTGFCKKCSAPKPMEKTNAPAEKTVEQKSAIQTKKSDAGQLDKTATTLIVVGLSLAANLLVLLNSVASSSFLYILFCAFGAFYLFYGLAQALRVLSGIAKNSEDTANMLRQLLDEKKNDDTHSSDEYKDKL